MLRIKLLCLVLFLSVPDTSWVLKKNTDNIRIYTRKISTSDFKELQCKLTVKATLGAVVKLLTDVDGYTEWIYGCIKAISLKKDIKAQSYSYQLFDAPWPVTDRDIVAVGKTTQNAKTKVVTIKSEVVTGMVPEVDGVVRIKKFHSTYFLIPKPNGEVEINFELGSEPGGIVPAWLVNMVVVKGPFESHSKLRTLLQTKKYKDAKLEYIEEL
jgi:hypothetical protein